MTNTQNFVRIVTELKSLTVGFPHKIYAVGGCVRDLIMGVPSHDIDIVVDAPGGEQKLADFLMSNHPDKIRAFVPNIKFGTNRFNIILGDGEEEQIDCAMTRTETYNQGSRNPATVGYAGVNVDALRRDFTLNALYYDIQTNAILDPTGRGQEDLKRGILQTPLDPAETFNEDPLRMLRAVRFKHCKGFSLSDEVVEGIKIASSKLSIIARERIGVEIEKIMMSNTPAEGIIDLHELGLLNYILPEFDNFWGMDQKSKFHNLSFTDHCLEVLRKVSSQSKSLELRMAALLHDISKPTAEGHQEKEDGRWTYVGHDRTSAPLAEKICMERLKYSREFAKNVAFFVRYHMIIKQLWNPELKEYKAKDESTRKAVRVLGDKLQDEMILIDADNCSHHPDHCLVGQVSQFYDVLKGLEIADYSTPLVDGNEICELLGVKPGKAVKLFMWVVEGWRDQNPNLKKEDLPGLIRIKKNFNKELLEAIVESKKVSD